MRQYKTLIISDEIIELADPDEEYLLQQLALKNLEEDVTRSIDQLPDRCREIFILSRYELLSNIEISERLNISVNTVKTHISRALDSLRISLNEYLLPKAEGAKNNSLRQLMAKKFRVKGQKSYELKTKFQKVKC